MASILSTVATLFLFLFSLPMWINCVYYQYGFHFDDSSQANTCSIEDVGPINERADIKEIADKHAFSHLSKEHSKLDIASDSSDVFSRFKSVKKWDKNWDERDIKHLIDQKIYDAASKYEKREMVKELVNTATRNIYLIRHGQYDMESKDKFLTELGREQAALLGRRLADTETLFTSITVSTMNRARETAKIMLQQLQNSELNQNITHDKMLEEGIPFPPEPPIDDEGLDMRDHIGSSTRLEAAFKKYFHRSLPKQKYESNELYVFHGNAIRYFVCRILQFPPEGWLRMTVGNASLTWIAIYPNGHVSLNSLGDIGHLSPDKISFY